MLVFVMHFVEMLVEERNVVHAMREVGSVVLEEEDNWNLKKEPRPTILSEFVIHFCVSAVIRRVPRNCAGEYAAAKQ